MVAVGQAFTVAPVVALKAVAGDQVYVLAPLAVRFPQVPWQSDIGATVIVGLGLTVMQTTLDVTLPQPETTAWKQVFTKSGAVTNGVVVAAGILLHGPVDVGPDCH